MGSHLDRNPGEGGTFGSLPDSGGGGTPMSGGAQKQSGQPGDRGPLLGTPMSGGAQRQSGQPGDGGPLSYIPPEVLTL